MFAGTKLSGTCGGATRMVATEMYVSGQRNAITTDNHQRREQRAQNPALASAQNVGIVVEIELARRLRRWFFDEHARFTG